MDKRAVPPNTYDVRMVIRGLWTYDLYLPGRTPEYSVGECANRREATRRARAAVRRLLIQKEP